MRIISLYEYIIGFLGGLLLIFSGDMNSVNASQKNVLSDQIFQAKQQYSINKTALTEIKYIPGKTFSINTSDTTSFIIPLKRIGRLFVIEATIDGESGNLIFDTGATNLVLNRTYFRDHVISGEIVSSGITGNVSQVDRITVDNVNIGKLTYKGISAHMADLGHIENRRGIKVLGLFGFELIKSFEITFDVEKNSLILCPIDSRGNLLNAGKQFIPDFTQTIETAKNVLFVKASIGEKTLRFCFDTGSETNALNGNLNKTVLQTVSITRTVRLKGAGSSSREVIYGRMNNFLFGDTLLNNMETIITYMDHLNDAYAVHIDGVLGYDFISKGNFCINFAKKQMGISYINQGKQ